jgi:hypothetical protein
MVDLLARPRDLKLHKNHSYSALFLVPFSSDFTL